MIEPRCPHRWSSIILGVSVNMFLCVIGIYVGKMQGEPIALLGMAESPPVETKASV